MCRKIEPEDLTRQPNNDFNQQSSIPLSFIRVQGQLPRFNTDFARKLKQEQAFMIY